MKALVMIADYFEDSELLVPIYWLNEEGVEIDIASIRKGKVKGNRGYVAAAARTLDEVKPDDYELLVLPGGRSSETIMKAEQALRIARCFFDKDKYVASICHGSRVLISAGLLEGRHATGPADLASELKKAGALLEENEVVVDGGLITCRRPSGLPALSKALIALILTDKRRFRDARIPAPCIKFSQAMLYGKCVENLGSQFFVPCMN